jgi:hypothetical protein
LLNVDFGSELENEPPRQPHLNNQQSSIINHQSSIINHQSSIINHQSAIHPGRRVPTLPGPTPDP